jgi:Flp pilus assembly protein CpaB
VEFSVAEGEHIMKWSVVGLVLVGLIAAVAVTFIFAEYRTGGSLKDLFQPREDTRTVVYVVAAKELPSMTILDNSKVKSVEELLSEAPEEIRESVRKNPPEHFTHAEDLFAKVVKLDLPEGKPIFRNDLVKGRLDAQLEENERAVAVPLDDTKGLAGILQPGSLVDIVATFRPPAGSAYQRARPFSMVLIPARQVLGINQELVVRPTGGEDENAKAGTRPGSRRARMVTLRLTREEASRLILAQETAKIHLSLRNPLHAESGDDIFDPVYFPPMPWDTQETGIPSGPRKPPVDVPGTPKNPAWIMTIFHGSEGQNVQFEPPGPPEGATPDSEEETQPQGGGE